jgi:hypothetical protein
VREGPVTFYTYARELFDTRNEPHYHCQQIWYLWRFMSVKLPSQLTPAGINKNDGKEVIAAAHGGQWKGFVAGVFSGIAKLSVG